MPSDTSDTNDAKPPLTLRDLAAIDVAKLQGVSTRMQDRLEQVGILNVRDLLERYPRRHHDRTQRADIATATVGEEITIVGEVSRVEVVGAKGAGKGGARRGGRSRVVATVSDGRGYLRCTFFGQPWRAKQLTDGLEVAVFGRLEVFGGVRQLTNPALDVLGERRGPGETGTIVPVYPQSEKAGIESRHLRVLVAEALRRCRARGIADPLPDDTRRSLGLVTREAAYRGIHAPATMADVAKARERLVFDEFLRMQLGLVLRKRALAELQHGIAHPAPSPLVDRFLAALPFPLTGDQRGAIAAISADLARPAPMHRLLQGDVGSGKTLVALAMLLQVIDGGGQGALLAPTEVLAEQHWLGITDLLQGLEIERPGSLFTRRPVRTALLTGRATAAQRREIHAGLRSGDLDLLVGTHALIEDTVEFAALGGVVVDEQHRFGVEQREKLRAKGGDRAPDVLVMTATPIPRTAAMLVYGDLDRSELREMPPGRVPITTEHVSGNPMERDRAFATLREEVAAGRQGYVVCSLVGDIETAVEAKAVLEEYERLQHEELVGLRLGLLYGRMPAADKSQVMAAFRDHQLDVLVSTTVIEVGVNVPNATVMIIEDADRFGLAQLHQLRGRVGRGGGRSWCFLSADPSTPDGQERLDAMVASTDGFALAERDLELRGAGEFFGDRQSGISDLKIARIPRDEAAVGVARAVAERLVDADPELSSVTALRDEVDDLLGDAVEHLRRN